MRTPERVTALLKYWPTIVVAAGGVLTLIWIGALVWLLAAFFGGFSGV